MSSCHTRTRGKQGDSGCTAGAGSSSLGGRPRRASQRRFRLCLAWKAEWLFWAPAREESISCREESISCMKKSRGALGRATGPGRWGGTWLEHQMWERDQAWGQKSLVKVCGSGGGVPVRDRNGAS